MIRRRLPLLLVALVGLVTFASLAYGSASPTTPLSEFGPLVLWAALVVSFLGLVVALIALWRSLHRPMLWFGMLGGMAFLSVAIVLLLIPNERLRYDPETVKIIKAGMAIEEVEEVLGMSLTSIIYDRGNPDRSYTIITTRNFSYQDLGGRKEWRVAEEAVRVRFDENRRVLSKERVTCTRDESFFETARRRLTVASWLGR